MSEGKIAIRCSTIPEKGYGNFSRCLYIAESLRKNKVKISFIIDYNRLIINTLKKRKFNFVFKKNIKNLQHEINFILNHVNKNNIDTIIIDMRERGEPISKLLSNQHKKLIFFDDAWCKNVYADILFNGTNVQNYHNYKKIKKNSKLFLNTKYWILDEKFTKYRKKFSDIKQKKKYHVVISMGGSDPNNLTIDVVKAIMNIKIIKITVLVGPLFSNLSELKKIIKNQNEIKLVHSSNKVWKVFSGADIAITNGGNTLFELAALSVPTLSIPAFTHEIKNVDAFMSENFSINLGFKQRNFKKIRSELLRVIEDLSLRKKMYSQGKKIVDGKGLSRVIKIILRNLS